MSMDPIGTTYVGRFSPIAPSEKSGQNPGHANSSANASYMFSSAQQAASSKADYVQSGTSSYSEKQQDFSTYNSAGLIEGAFPKSATAVRTDQDQTARPGQKAQDDPQVEQVVARMKATEEKVKAHEAAHKSAGGAATGPVSYTYARGPDGRNYITGGEVPISISSGSTPQETISRMQQVIQAALAPADPSPQDRAVAAQAANIKQQAEQEKAQQNKPLPGDGTDNQAAISAPITPSRTADSSQAREKATSGREVQVSGYPATTADVNSQARPISFYA